MRHSHWTAFACTSLLANGLHAAPASEAPNPDAADPSSTPAAPATSTEAAPSLTAPRLLAPVEPKYPEALRASGQSARVGLVLKLDSSGT
ncbi:MAG TPA: hypothetical protein VG963_13755, partial [Polyangiaceae bacterium]|nr:hypothetical protein [Polyangiaceae bacterium]